MISARKMIIFGKKTSVSEPGLQKMLTNRRSRYYRNLIERSNRKNSILSKANRTLESKKLDIIESESNARIEKTRYESNANRNRKRCVLTEFNSLSSRICKYRKRKRNAKVKTKPGISRLLFDKNKKAKNRRGVTHLARIERNSMRIERESNAKSKQTRYYRNSNRTQIEKNSILSKLESKPQYCQLDSFLQPRF